MSRICVTSVTPGAIDLPSATFGELSISARKAGGSARRRSVIAQREVGEDAGVEDYERRTRHSWPGGGGDSAESVKLLLPMLAIVEEAPNRLFDQFVAAPIVATGEFLLDLSKEENAEAGPCTAGSRTSPNPLSSIPSCP